MNKKQWITELKNLATGKDTDIETLKWSKLEWERWNSGNLNADQKAMVSACNQLGITPMPGERSPGWISFSGINAMLATSMQALKLRNSRGRTRTRVINLNTESVSDVIREESENGWKAILISDEFYVGLHGYSSMSNANDAGLQWTRLPQRKKRSS